MICIKGRRMRKQHAVPLQGFSNAEQRYFRCERFCWRQATSAYPQLLLVGRSSMKRQLACKLRSQVLNAWSETQQATGEVLGDEQQTGRVDTGCQTQSEVDRVKNRG